MASQQKDYLEELMDKPIEVDDEVVMTTLFYFIVMYVCLYIFIYVCMHICVCLTLHWNFSHLESISSYSYWYMHTYTYIHTYILYIHTYIHTYTQVPYWSSTHKSIHIYILYIHFKVDLVFSVKPTSAKFVKAKINVDAETQIEKTDFFEFDVEVEPFLEVLVSEYILLIHKYIHTYIHIQYIHTMFHHMHTYIHTYIQTNNFLINMYIKYTYIHNTILRNLKLFLSTNVTNTYVHSYYIYGMIGIPSSSFFRWARLCIYR